MTPQGQSQPMRLSLDCFFILLVTRSPAAGKLSDRSATAVLAVGHIRHTDLPVSVYNVLTEHDIASLYGEPNSGRTMELKSSGLLASKGERWGWVGDERRAV